MLDIEKHEKKHLISLAESHIHNSILATIMSELNKHQQLFESTEQTSLTTEMLLNGIAGKVSKEQKKYLKDILSGIKNMTEIIETMLNVSRIELGSFAQNDKEINIVKFINSLIKENRSQIKNKKIFP